MSIAALDAKWDIPSLIWAGHDLFEHFIAASPLSLTAFDPQTGLLGYPELERSLGPFYFFDPYDFRINSPSLRTRT
jgi:hypothetical protein